MTALAESARALAARLPAEGLRAILDVDAYVGEDSGTLLLFVQTATDWLCFGADDVAVTDETTPLEVLHELLHLTECELKRQRRAHLTLLQGGKSHE